MFYLYICLCTMWIPSVHRYAGNGVTYDCELPFGCWKLNLGPLLSHLSNPIVLFFFFFKQLAMSNDLCYWGIYERFTVTLKWDYGDLNPSFWLFLIQHPQTLANAVMRVCRVLAGKFQSCWQVLVGTQDNCGPRTNIGTTQTRSSFFLNCHSTVWSSRHLLPPYTCAIARDHCSVKTCTIFLALDNSDRGADSSLRQTGSGGVDLWKEYLEKH